MTVLREAVCGGSPAQSKEKQVFWVCREYYSLRLGERAEKRATDLDDNHSPKWCQDIQALIVQNARLLQTPRPYYL